MTEKLQLLNELEALFRETLQTFATNKQYVQIELISEVAREEGLSVAEIAEAYERAEQ